MARLGNILEWAENGTKTDPGAPKIDTGHTTEIADPGDENYIMNYVTNLLANAEQFGIMEWHLDTLYKAGGLTLGSNSIIYQAVIDNDGNDPISDGGTNWLRFGMDFSNVASGYVVDVVSGFTIQWGRVLVNSNDVGSEHLHTLAIAFNTAHMVAVASPHVTSSSESGEAGANNHSLTQVALQNAHGGGSRYISYICIGY